MKLNFVLFFSFLVSFAAMADSPKPAGRHDGSPAAEAQGAPHSGSGSKSGFQGYDSIEAQLQDGKYNLTFDFTKRSGSSIGRLTFKTPNSADTGKLFIDESIDARCPLCWRVDAVDDKTGDKLTFDMELLGGSTWRIKGEDGSVLSVVKTALSSDRNSGEAEEHTNLNGFTQISRTDKRNHETWVFTFKGRGKIVGNLRIVDDLNDREVSNQPLGLAPGIKQDGKEIVILSNDIALAPVRMEFRFELPAHGAPKVNGDLATNFQRVTSSKP